MNMECKTVESYQFKVVSVVQRLCQKLLEVGAVLLLIELLGLKSCQNARWGIFILSAFDNVFVWNFKFYHNLIFAKTRSVNVKMSGYNFHVILTFMVILLFGSVL